MSYPSANNTSINNELYANLVTAAQFAAYEQSVARQLVTVFDAPLNTGLNLQVPIWSSVSADLIADEAAATVKNTNTTSATITLKEHVVYHQVTDQLRDSAYSNVFAQLGDQSGRAIAESMDKQVFDAMADGTYGFSTDLGTAGAELTPQLILKAAATLRQRKLTGPFYAVVHPGAAYGLKKNLTATLPYAGAGGLVNPSDLGNDVLRGFYIGTIAGVEIYESALVPVSGTDATCAVFARTAFGHAMRGSIDMNTLYLPAYRATDVVLKAVAGATTLNALHGVTITATTVIS
jgi:N4-gp56 family major capsid protein